MSDIQIKVLSNRDFDNLGVEHTRGADISDSLGFADVYSNKIYVRDTGIDELNNYLISHEVEHLFEEHGTDLDPNVDGIRHKKFFKEVVAPLFTGVNLETKKFSPAGILDPSITKKAQQKKQSQGQEDSDIGQNNRNSVQLGGQAGGPLGAFSVNAPASQQAGNATGGQVAGVLNQGSLNSGTGGS